MRFCQHRIGYRQLQVVKWVWQTLDKGLVLERRMAFGKLSVSFTGLNDETVQSLASPPAPQTLPLVREELFLHFNLWFRRSHVSILPTEVFFFFHFNLSHAFLGSLRLGNMAMHLYLLSIVCSAQFSTRRIRIQSYKRSPPRFAKMDLLGWHCGIAAGEAMPGTQAYPIRVPVCVLAASYLIQLLANGWESRGWALHPCGRPRWSSWLLVLV